MIKIALLGGPSAGKCLGYGTRVILFDGSIKAVEELTESDLLMGDDSTPRKILSIHKGIAPLYKIIQNNGYEFTCTENHILSLKLNHHNQEKTVNISVKEYLESSSWKQNRLKSYQVPVEFKENTIFIDPYFIGAWLGDGLSASCRICVADTEIIDWLESYIKTFNLYLKQHSNKIGIAQTYAISSGRMGGIAAYKNPILNEMYRLNLINNKHIPYEYKINSIENRKKLLAGLIDTDGSKIDNNRYELIFKNKILAEDVIFVAKSLGYKATISKSIKSSQNGTEGLYYRIYLSGDFTDTPILLPRKKSANYNLRTNPLRNGIKVEKIDTGKYVGFELDGNKLHLLEDFTVTHNSTLAARLFAELKEEGIKTELVQEFARELINRIGGWRSILNQYLIYEKQLDKELILPEQVEVMVTDCPTILSYIYALHYYDSNDVEHQMLLVNMYEKMIMNIRQYDLIYYLEPNRPYVLDGTRQQSEEEAKLIGQKIRMFLDLHKMPYTVLTMPETEARVQKIKSDVALTRIVRNSEELGLYEHQNVR